MTATLERRASRAPRDSADYPTGTLDRILGLRPPPFALIHRPNTTGPGWLEVLVGDVGQVERLADLPLGESVRGGRARPGLRHELLVLVPYRQIVERGYACHDDAAPLIVLRPTEQMLWSVPAALRCLPDARTELVDAHLDVPDADYAAAVRRVLTEEIGNGEGSNFVLSHSMLGRIPGYSARSALAIFRRLLRRELGAYWTFVAYTGDRTLVGATPERHVSLRGGMAAMNPISGTYRYGPAGPDPAEALRFLADTKESDELYMVVDEELKMMARVCEAGGRVRGPYLREMAYLAHTEYHIEGGSRLDVREVLRLTMFAPTVTGSPLESSCRVIRRHERTGRGYYGGALALIGRDAAGRQELDSAILIRTAQIDRAGRVRIAAGSTLVRHSDPDGEAAETRAKMAVLLEAIGGADPGPAAARRPARPLSEDPAIQAELAGRNVNLAGFWLGRQERPATPSPLPPSRVLVVDAEDEFVAMLAHQLRALGQEVVVRGYREPWDPGGFDLVVVGPGPGNPCDGADSKIRALRRITRLLLEGDTPFLSVCLGHQVLASVLGLRIVRKRRPNQGTQLAIDLFGDHHLAGFYNTFVAVSAWDRFAGPRGRVEVSRDPRTGEVHSLRGPHFRSVQFHAESILTQRGVAILRDMLSDLRGNSRGVRGEPPGPPKPGEVSAGARRPPAT